ncbi:MAG: DUF2845 domain-containing protein [Thermodesulfobacteriota bacterium]|nr:DUF2845 domain-containing protein [Thermodesulfobacteriota bacterium]
MKRTSISAIIITLFFILPATAISDDSWRCRSKVVHVGDDMATVLSKCGEPLTRTYSGSRTSWGTHRVGRTTYGKAHSVPIESWTYRTRRGSFPRILTFRGGMLYNIRLGEK